MAELPDRADYIGDWLSYATCVGPALGKAMLMVTSPKYMVLIMMQIITPAAFESTGDWEFNRPPCAEEEEEFEENTEGETRKRLVPKPKNPKWQGKTATAISLELLRDAELAKRLFPDSYTRDMEPTLNEAIDALQNKFFNPNGNEAGLQLPDPISVPAGFKDCITAIEIAHSRILEHQKVRRRDYAASQKKWICVDIPDDPCCIECIRRADARIFEFMAAENSIKNHIGKRMASLSIKELVMAGALIGMPSANDRTNAQQQEMILLMSEWPFEKEQTESDIKTNLRRHLYRKIPIIAEWTGSRLLKQWIGDTTKHKPL